MLGQTYRLKPDPIFGPDSGQRGTTSDLVGRVSVKFLPYIDLTDRIDVDRTNGTVRRHEVYLTGIYDRSTLADQLCPAAGGSGDAGPRRPRGNQRAGRHQLLRELAGLRRAYAAIFWPDRCSIPSSASATRMSAWEFPIAYRRKFTTDRDLPPSTSIILRFNLKTGDETDHAV